MAREQRVCGGHDPCGALCCAVGWPWRVSLWRGGLRRGGLRRGGLWRGRSDTCSPAGAEW